MMKHNALTILLVEDEIKLAYTLSRALEKALGKNTQIKICSTAEAALQMLHIYPIELLITDWRLPGMSGLDFVTKARQLYPNLPVIFMTAFGTEEVEREVCQRFDVYINKPFEIPDFIQIVNQVIRVHQTVDPNPQTSQPSDETHSFQTILILEDSNSLLTLLRKAFQRAGFLVYGASTIQEAEKHLGREHIDIFVCGIALDNGFGVPLLQKWGKVLLENRTKVFVMSGDPLRSLMTENLDANFFFQKPVEIPVMVSVANSLSA